jgi:hypothetical protein
MIRREHADLDALMPLKHHDGQVFGSTISSVRGFKSCEVHLVFGARVIASEDVAHVVPTEYLKWQSAWRSREVVSGLRVEAREFTTNRSLPCLSEQTPQALNGFRWRRHGWQPGSEPLSDEVLALAGPPDEQPPKEVRLSSGGIRMSGCLDISHRQVISAQLPGNPPC